MTSPKMRFIFAVVALAAATAVFSAAPQAQAQQAPCNPAVQQCT